MTSHRQDSWTLCLLLLSVHHDIDYRGHSDLPELCVGRWQCDSVRRKGATFWSSEIRIRCASGSWAERSRYQCPPLQYWGGVYPKTGKTDACCHRPGNASRWAVVTLTVRGIPCSTCIEWPRGIVRLVPRRAYHVRELADPPFRGKDEDRSALP